ncbi:hypothetical protein PBCVCVR1_240L [Paramecium bursaria Chlorella virus CVR-1]|uniref:Uncharacterized protein n=1 Tax=Paramecium bursaria Chlorella virus CVA-1 TaxID=42683 RepID=M1GXY9_9PHYC|nr:hypothetical protein F8205_gp078 [Paramecium bursaria Chlorella virus CVA-1]AGE48746.1 hypothetical protein PBCVAP110A_241L [Paramecium bursaria Chlorella virus AP110A]AGE50433.1 hypothetical protein PBCVCVA1_233L [Paramecium bursaria Chlorella virus CVA-1]AGE52112.1 hypothetical protein PBCVCVR1_240L [Paramecium bursaria Chlorella virus CVR-1]
MNTFAEISCSEAAVHVISEFALKRKLNHLQLAMLVPGVIHSHTPSEQNTSDCVYCQRNGNVFNPKQKTVDTDDIISRYRAQVRDILEKMEVEIISTLESKISS